MSKRIETRIWTAAVLCLVTFSIGGCGLFGFLDRTKDYEKSESNPPLEVPPDLSRPVEDPAMQVPQTQQVAGEGVDKSPEPPDLDDSPLPEAPDIELPKDASGAPYLELEDHIQSAWRRTGYALERTGFTIEERDDSRWLYAVNYAPPKDKDDDGGFFHWLFGGGDDKNAGGERRYQVSLVGEGENRTRIMVLNEAGEPESGEAAQRILSLLADRLRS